MTKYILKTLAFVIGSLLVLGVVSFSLLQLPQVQHFLTHKLEEEAKKYHIDLHVEGISGIAPIRWSFKKASLTWEDCSYLKIENFKIKLSLFPLLKKKISIRFMSCEDLLYAFSPTPSSTPLVISSLPFSLSARTLSCKRLTLEDLSSHHRLSFQVQGSAKANRSLKEVSLHLFLKEEQNSLDLSLSSSYKKKKLDSLLSLNVQDANSLALFFSLPCTASFSALCHLEGDPTKNTFALALKSHITSLHVPQIPTVNRPFDIELQLNTHSSPQEILSCNMLSLQSDWIDLSGTFTLSSALKPLEGKLSGHLKKPEVLSLPYQGEATLEARLCDAHAFLATLSSPAITIGQETFSPVSFKLSAYLTKETWIGTLQGSLAHPLFPWEEEAHFLLTPPLFQFSDLTFSSPTCKIGGSASFTIGDGAFFSPASYQGSFFVMANDLKPFRTLIPFSEMQGKIGGTFAFEGSHAPHDLSLKTNFLLKGIRFQNHLVDTAHLETDLQHLLTTPTGLISLEAENLFLRGILLSNLCFLSRESPSNTQTFTLETQGKWKESISLQVQGEWGKTEAAWKLDLQKCHGTFLNTPFLLSQPCTLSQQLLTPSTWEIGHGTLFAELQLHDNQLFFSSQGNHLPLEMLGLLFPKLSFQGEASFQTSLSGPMEKLQGKFLATLEEADFLQTKAKGSLQIHFNPLGAQVHTHLYAPNHQFLDWTATIPLNYSYTPFSCHLNPVRPLTSELTMQGAIEEIFDFINTASHKTSGWITAHLFFTHQQKKPSLQGSIEWQNGGYKNFYTGTVLTGIEASMTASEHALILSHLQAHDEKQGTLEAQGNYQLSLEEKLPFEGHIVLDNMHLAQSDFIDAYVSGYLDILGDRSSTKVSGQTEVKQAHISLLDDIFSEIPTLPVVYINQPLSLQEPLVQSPSVYPITLDLAISSNQTVHIQGKGLDSTWQGELHLGGTPNHLGAQGSLSLVKGEFLFSGKTFTLQQGELSFSDKPSPSAYLKLVGELHLPSTTILAHMQGPLTSPRLTFQSTPPLPTSSILSLILFNKDVSEISPLQALQLAQTIVSLSGGGSPALLESIRKSMGIDRLNIVGKDGTDEISLQIGWYLNHGITLSLSQSATSSDITVEVDLKNGFLFQAETQNQEEGKFSLKWNRNY